MAEEQPPAAEGSSEDRDAMAGEQPPAAEGSSEDRDAMAEEQPPSREDPSPAEDAHAAADGAATERRTLRRSSTDKVIAGVAGGIGAYFGIDSVIVRIAFIVLTFLGGAGPFLYLIGWLALPTEDSPSVIAKALGGNSPHRFRSLLAVALIGLGLIITANLSGSLFGLFVGVWSIAPYLALILIAAGVALVLWPGPAGGSKPTPARPPVPPAPPPGTPAAVLGVRFARADSPRSGRAGVGSVPPTGPPPPAGVPSPPAKRRRDRSWIGSATVAALFMYTGAALMLDRLDVIATDVGVFFALALAITGAGLLASAFVAPARSLIWLGAAISALLLLIVGADVPRGSGIGEARVTVADIEELEDEYRHGVGQLVVDLRDLDPERTDHSVDLSLGIGELRVYVPDSISTTADIKVGVGSIDARGAGYAWYESTDGLRTRLTIAVPAGGETTGELRLDIDVGIGEVEVRSVPAAIGRSVRQ